MENDILEILESMPINLKDRDILWRKELDSFTLSELKGIYAGLERISDLITDKLEGNLFPLSLNKLAELFNFKIYVQNMPERDSIQGINDNVVSILMMFKENIRKIVVDVNAKDNDEITRVSIAFCIAQYVLDIMDEEEGEYFSVCSFEDFQRSAPNCFNVYQTKEPLIKNIAYVLALNVLIPKSALNEINKDVKSSQLSYDEKISLLAGFFGVRDYDIEKRLEYFDYTLQ